MPRTVTLRPWVTVHFNETRGSRFFKYDPTATMVPSRWLARRPIDLEVHDDALAGLDNEGVDRLCAEGVYQLGNADDRPNGRTERSISVGDVITIHGPSWLSPDRHYAVEMRGLRLLTVPDEWPPHPAPDPAPDPAPARPRGRRSHDLPL